MKDAQTPSFADYIEREQLLPLVRQHFPTDESLKWFVRQNHNVLAESGAMISITNRLKFEPTRFQQMAIKIGRNAAISRKQTR